MLEKIKDVIVGNTNFIIEVSNLRTKMKPLWPVSWQNATNVPRLTTTTRETSYLLARPEKAREQHMQTIKS